MELELGADFALPSNAVSETVGIFGVRGSGKTTTARVLVEELTRAGEQVVVIDPIGVWFGLRSWADGRPGGYPFVIIGGPHADVSLGACTAAALAAAIYRKRRQAILDLSDLRGTDQRSFVAEFVEQLYSIVRSPLHVVIDECDVFCPQRRRRGGEVAADSIEDLVRRGRTRGLGCTLISQRPAIVSKDVLSQISLLVVHRLLAPQDHDAVLRWVRPGTRDAMARMVAGLPSLPTGTAWVWSPNWLDEFRRVTIRRPATYDSSATPGENVPFGMSRSMQNVRGDEPETGTTSRAMSGGGDIEGPWLKVGYLDGPHVLELAEAERNRPPTGHRSDVDALANSRSSGFAGLGVGDLDAPTRTALSRGAVELVRHLAALSPPVSTGRALAIQMQLEPDGPLFATYRNCAERLGAIRVVGEHIYLSAHQPPDVACDPWGDRVVDSICRGLLLR